MTKGYSRFITVLFSAFLGLFLLWHIALPDQDRASHTAAFCAQAASRLSAVECALMEE